MKKEKRIFIVVVLERRGRNFQLEIPLSVDNLPMVPDSICCCGLVVFLNLCPSAFLVPAIYHAEPGSRQQRGNLSRVWRLRRLCVL